MKPLFDFINEQSDDSIYYRLAKNMWAWTFHRSKPESIKSAIRKYGITQDNPRRGLVKWFKANYPPIPDSSKEVIKRSQWDIEGIVGQTENQIMHPHYDEIVRYHCAHPDKRHDVLLIFECSNKKPYNDDSSKIPYLRIFDDCCDFANADYGLIPYAFCELYPYRYDEWDHYSEGEYGAWWYREVSKINFKIFMDAWGYKRAVVVMQNPHPRRFLKEIKEQNLFGWGDKLEFVTDDAFDKEMKKKYSSVFGGTGLIVTRMLGLPETKLKTVKLVKKALEAVNAPKEQIDRLSEVYKVMNKADKSNDSLGKALKAAGLNTKRAYAEWPYGEKKDEKEEKKDIKEYFGQFTMFAKPVMEASQQDFQSKLTKLQKELDDLDIEKIKEQKVEKEMGDIDLVKNPDDLYEIYQWAWPCGKLLYWMMDKKLDVTLQKDYDTLKAFMKKQSDWGCINEYFFYYKPLVEKMGWKDKDVYDAALKIHFIEDHKDILNFNIKDYWK